MPVVTMTTRENFEKNVGNPDFWIDHTYPGHEAGRIVHSPACAHYRAETSGVEYGPGHADCVDYGDPRANDVVDFQTGVYGAGNGGKVGYLAGYCHGPFEPLYMQRTHVGLVLAEGEINGYDDSDFYALVWDPAAGKPEKVFFGTTRGWTYPNGCQVDATPEVVAAYEAWRERMAAQEREERRLAEEREVRRGKRVKVVRGRKVPVGTEGEVFWLGSGIGGPRVGIKGRRGEVHWTALTNVEVVLGA